MTLCREFAALMPWGCHHPARHGREALLLSCGALCELAERKFSECRKLAEIQYSRTVYGCTDFDFQAGNFLYQKLQIVGIFQS